jgi:hypothetical protein
MGRLIVSTGALALLLALGAGAARGDASVKPPPKGQPGAACKTNADCDQTNQTQTCNQGKCQVFRVPPPT